jgi:hypothetical protein
VDIVTHHHHGPREIRHDGVNLTDVPHVNTTLVVAALSSLENSSPPISAVAPINPVEHILLPIASDVACHDSLLADHSEESDDYLLQVPAALLLKDEEKSGLKWPEDEMKPPALSYNDLARAGFHTNVEEGVAGSMNDQIPNRVIRPAIVKIPKQSK